MASTVPELGSELAAPQQGLAQTLAHTFDVPLQLLQLSGARRRRPPVGAQPDRAFGCPILGRSHRRLQQETHVAALGAHGPAHAFPAPRALGVRRGGLLSLLGDTGDGTGLGKAPTPHPRFCLGPGSFRRGWLERLKNHPLVPAHLDSASSFACAPGRSVLSARWIF